ncbi:MAG TPA: hypothetical protein EYQ77_01165, partial [Methylococcaceae bacterium]|nr:hypothetical protein [Methylococcaceae bacterium]
MTKTMKKRLPLLESFAAVFAVATVAFMTALPAIQDTGERNVDLQDKQELDVPFTCVNLENFGETVEAITQIDDRINGIDAIVHQAAIPAPGLY